MHPASASTTINITINPSTIINIIVNHHLSNPSLSHMHPSIYHHHQSTHLSSSSGLILARGWNLRRLHHIIVYLTPTSCWPLTYHHRLVAIHLAALAKAILHRRHWPWRGSLPQQERLQLVAVATHRLMEEMM